MERQRLAILEADGHVSARSDTVYFKNVTDGDIINMPVNGVFPGWVCKVIVSDASKRVVVRGDTVVNGSPEPCKVLTVTAMDRSSFVVESVTSGGESGVTLARRTGALHFDAGQGSMRLGLAHGVSHALAPHPEAAGSGQP